MWSAQQLYTYTARKRLGKVTSPKIKAVFCWVPAMFIYQQTVACISSVQSRQLAVRESPGKFTVRRSLPVKTLIVLQFVAVSEGED
jgi:hypothetical protein